MTKEVTGYFDRNEDSIYEGAEILYQVGSKFEEKAVIKWLAGELVIEFESGVSHIMTDFWYPPVDEEITLII